MSTYQTSKDYALLWELAMAGKEIICFVDYTEDGKSLRDTTVTQKIDSWIEIGTRSVCYISVDNKGKFIEKCEKYHVEFIPPSGWIPVSERLPENGQKILVQYSDGCMVTMLYHTISFLKPEFIAWMPLPEPYEVGK